MEKKDVFTVRDLRKYGAEILKSSDIEEATLDADLLLMEALGFNRSDLFLNAKKEVDAKIKEKYFNWLMLRSRRVPFTQIVGNTEFMGLSFKVSDKVLSPRQDTEILVETAAKYMKDAESVLDVCTGSGCIIISLCKLYGEKVKRAVATDISEDALKIARENAKKQETNIVFFKGDLFNSIPNEYRFDIITINPPYIEKAVIETLEPEVKDYEPRIALDGGEDGLSFYRRIMARVRDYLSDRGRLLMEIGHNQAKDVEIICNKAGFYNTEVIKDYAGNDRVICVYLGETYV